MFGSIGNYTTVAIKIPLSREGAEQLRQFIPQAGHEAMYSYHPTTPYTEYHWRLPSDDKVNHPVYVGRNIKGYWFVLSQEPAGDNLKYSNFFSDLSQVRFGETNLNGTLAALAFTIISCELVKYSHFKVVDGMSLTTSASLQKYINKELASIGESRARVLTQIEDSMWAAPSLPEPVDKEYRRTDLSWASHIDLGQEIKAKRTQESFGSFMANHGNLRDQTGDFTVPNGDGSNHYPVKLNLRVLRLLISGNIYPINNGYAFIWYMSTYKDVLFVRDNDPRLEDIKEMRLRNLELMRELNDSAIRIKEGIKGTPFSIVDNEDTSLTSLPYSDQKDTE